MRHLIISALTLCFAASTGSAAPNLGDKPGKWEYAELKMSRSLAGPAARANAAVRPAAPATTVAWATLDGETEAETWEELASKLKAPPLKKDGTPTMQKLRVLNYLGTEGWEIVDHVGGDGVTGAASWTLKRRVP
jgi:hypothetical protein